MNVQYDDGDVEDLILENEIWKPAPKEIHFTAVLRQLSNKLQQHDEWTEQELKFARNSEDSGFFQERDILQIFHNPIDSRFTAASKDEIEGLVSRGSYKVVREEDIPENATILKSRKNNTIKTDENGIQKYKSRLIIQGHRDPQKSLVVTEALTILRSSIKLVLALSSMYDFHFWSRDVKQAFIQSAFPMDQAIYIKPPRTPNVMSMVGHPVGSYLKSLKLIYGLTESPGYLWQTFKQYHLYDLRMKQTALNLCLFVKKIEGKPVGLIGTLVDDNLECGNDGFMKLEET